MRQVRVSDRVTVPVVGLGVYQMSPREAERCVREAVDVGYRLVDTAQYYHNEEGVGRAVRRATAEGLRREDLVVTTKITASGQRAAARAIFDSLRRLDTGYIDLLLIHWPQGDDSGTWRAMEQALATGHLHAIGVSNFYGGTFTALAGAAEVTPAVNQVEAHVLRQQRELTRLMERYGTVLEAWSPLAHGRGSFLDHPVLRSIGAAHDASPAQVALACLLALGMVVIPKTTHRDRMEENLAAADLELSEDDMARLADLDTAASLFGWY